VRKTAILVKALVQEQAAVLLNVKDPSSLELRDRCVFAADGRSVTMAQVGLSSFHQVNQHQIIASASHVSPVSPPPTGATFAEVLVDEETGKVKVERLLMVVDCGRVINPLTAMGQVEGGLAQGLGFAMSEDMVLDETGHLLTTNFIKYKLPHAKEMPMLDVIFVQTDEPSGPYGAKSVSELSIDGVAPAIASAIHNAAGIWLRHLPYTPDKVLQALKEKK
jgi:putative selenate reductase molybdopterin-binding subunit